MTISSDVYELLPEDGSKVSGGFIREKLNLDKSDFTKAKESLKAENKIICGRGRGGTICRNVDTSSHIKLPEPIKPPTKAERMEHAREVKTYKKADSKRREEIEAEALKIGEKEFPDADFIETHVWNLDSGEVYVFPFYNGVGKTYRTYIKG